MSLAHIAIICDYIEENWPSMNLVAEMLLKQLHDSHTATVQATRICPVMKRHLGWLPLVGGKNVMMNTDRLLNRFWDYPELLKREREKFELFHLVDHSYAQLVHGLPAERTIVTCHDLDTFRCLLEPEGEPRSKLFVAMTRKIFDGLRKAARVTCDSHATRDDLLKYEVVPPERLSVIYNGVHPACSAEPDAVADEEAARLLGAAQADRIDLLHVGSTIARKRIDVLLRVFAAVRKEFPRARLLRAGGEFTGEQLKLVEQLGLAKSIVVLPSLSRPVLAAVYRRAALVLQPSEREGFGLPVIEAMACGAPVVASDLPVLREVGGEASVYCPVADVKAWAASVNELLSERSTQPEHWAARRAAGLAQASLFSWSEYARRMVCLYQELCAS